MLGLRDISPRWCAVIYEGEEANGLDIFNPSKCIVGEAWGFKKKYIKECNACSHASKELMLRFGDVDAMGPMIDRLLIHWNENHNGSLE
jgi:hypothetical protein